MSLESSTTVEHVVQGGNNSSSSICCAATFGPAFGSTLGLAMDAIVVTPSSFGSNNGHPMEETCEMTTTTTTTTTMTWGKNAGRVGESSPSVPPSQTQEPQEGIVASSDFIVQFPPSCIPKGSSTSSTSTSTSSSIKNDHQYVILLQINGNHLHESFLSMKLPAQHTGSKNGPQNCTFCTFQQGRSTKPSTDVLGKLVENSLLTPGRNLVRYFLVQKQCCHHHHHHRYTTIGQAEAYIYLWSVHDSIIISDIDGTLTKSDVRGVIDSIFMERYLDGVGHVHEGVCSLFTDLVKCPPMQLQHKQREKQQEKQQQDKQGTVDNKNSSSRMGQVRILYLSSRPMQLIHATRKFLSLLSQKRENVKQSSTNNNGNGNGNASSDHYHTTTTTTSAFALGSLSDKVACCRNGTNTDTTTATDTDTAATKTTTTTCTSASGISGSQNVWIPAVDQNHGQHASLVGLPPGPIFLHTGTLSTVLYAELVTKSMHEFKADLLTRQVVLPFVAAGKKVSKSPLFLAGFGNKKTDSLAYEMAGMNCNDIYIIDKKSVLVRIEDNSVLEEMEKKENRHNNNNNNDNSTSDKQSLAIDGNHGEVDMGACCHAWEPIVTNLCPSENLSSKKISVSNPKKLSSFYSPPPPSSSSSGASSSSSSFRNQRHFRGYSDPQLRKELFRRIASF